MNTLRRSVRLGGEKSCLPCSPAFAIHRYRPVVFPRLFHGLHCYTKPSRQHHIACARPRGHSLDGWADAKDSWLAHACSKKGIPGLEVRQVVKRIWSGLVTTGIMLGPVGSKCHKVLEWGGFQQPAPAEHRFVSCPLCGPVPRHLSLVMVMRRKTEKEKRKKYSCKIALLKKSQPPSRTDLLKRQANRKRLQVLCHWSPSHLVSVWRLIPRQPRERTPSCGSGRTRPAKLFPALFFFFSPDSLSWPPFMILSGRLCRLGRRGAGARGRV